MDRDKAIRAAKLTANQVNSHKAADQVADLLRQGRALEVTDDLMAQADPQRLHQHYTSGKTGVDMPMDEASRMARAREMGFNRNVYHGDAYSEKRAAFNRPNERAYFTYDPEDAGDYASYWTNSNPEKGRLFGEGAQIQNVMVRAQNRAQADDVADAYEYVSGKGVDGLDVSESWGPLHPDWSSYSLETADELRKRGFDSVFHADDSTPLSGEYIDSIAVLNPPTNIRSKFARFDPRLAHLSHLSASTGGAMELARHATAVGRAGGQIAPSKYMPNVPRAVHADGGKVAFQQGNHPDVPDVVYHGTQSDIKIFRQSQTGEFGPGIYTTDMPEEASDYAGTHPFAGKGPNVMPLHLSMKNPFVVKSDPQEFWQRFGGKTDADAQKNAIAEGYDGVIFRRPHMAWDDQAKREVPTGKFHTHFVAFHPNQIKSAIGNQGTFNPNDPDITKADGGEVTDSDNFRNWFGNSVTHTDGQPHVFYTGTSKDKDFTSHNVGRHGAWFVRDPAVASEYAEQNDSQGYKRDGWEITKTNTASRVIPAYVKAENPYTGELPEEYLRDNYKAAQSDWFDTLRAKGHDSWIPSSQNGNVVVALKEPQQIKSIFNNGKFDPNQKHMNKATGGQVMGYVPMASLPVSRLAVARAPVQQQQAPAGRFSDSLSSLMDTVEGFKKKPEADVERSASAPSPSAASEGHSPIGMIAMPESGYEATGMYAPFQSAIDQMIADAPGKITVTSGYRTPERQEELWNEHAAKYPDPEVRDDYVARPGQSSHNYGLAADLSYADEEALKWAHENAAKYGLNFRMGHEDWHIEPANIWELRNAMTVPGYSNGGSAMDDDNQDTSGGNNVESLSLARSLRNINSDEHTDPVKNIFANLSAGQKEAQKGYEMAHANGEFDDFKIGDTFVYRHAANPTPMKIIGFSMRHADSFPQGKRVYNNHVPALDMEDQIAGKKVNKYAVEWFKDNLHKYDFVSGKPRAVKAGGGSMDDDNQDRGMENGTTPINFATRPQAGELPDAGGIRGGAGVLQAQNEAPLEGLPQKIVIPMTGQIIQASADPRIRQVARDYMAQAGLPYSPPTKYARVDPKRAARIASDYTNMEDNPDDPLTKASYNAMIKETMDQYHAAKKSGLKIEFWNPRKQEDPYKASPRLATEDVRRNHHMWVFPTYSGYGSGEPISEDDAKKNPLLQLTGETWNGIPVTVNDVFRAIHDYYGHAKEGLGFRADGEENAWRAHASMFSPLARMAMTSETRGQNSWLNYGPHGEHNRKARTEDTIFAPQKIGVLSHLSHHEGAEDFIKPEEISLMASIRSRFGKKLGGAVDAALALTRRFTKDGKSAISALKPKGK